MPWWRRPLGIGFLGLVLIIGGWKASTWVPETSTAREREQANRLAELKRMEGDAEWQAKVEGYAHNARLPPYELPGRLAVFAGLVLFVVAGVRMYRAPALVKDNESVTESDGTDETDGTDELYPSQPSHRPW
jgi:hypothetical protein